MKLGCVVALLLAAAVAGCGSLPVADPRGLPVECRLYYGKVAGGATEPATDESRCYQLGRHVASPFSATSQAACAATNRGNGRLYEWTGLSPAGSRGPYLSLYVCRPQ